jgi:hypothetical protein
MDSRRFEDVFKVRGLKHSGILGTLLFAPLFSAVLGGDPLAKEVSSGREFDHKGPTHLRAYLSSVFLILS